jgi:nucleotide-binding universal stress UspA family protein
MKRILFPTDFSKTAENAFLYALTLASKTGAELDLIHVYELPSFGRALKSTTQQVHELIEMEELEDFKKSVDALRAIAEEHGMGHVDFTHEMIKGEAVLMITEKAVEMGVDYVVMGTKGATGLKEVFLGSVTSGVMEHTRVPVLSIPDEVTYKHEIENVTYLTNYRQEETIGFEQALDFANIFGAKLICLHLDVNEEIESHERMEKWRSTLNKGNVQFKVEKGDNIEQSLSGFIALNEIDVVAVQPRKKGLFTRLFSTSVSKKIAHHVQVPLLTFPVE